MNENSLYLYSSASFIQPKQPSQEALPSSKSSFQGRTYYQMMDPTIIVDPEILFDIALKHHQEQNYVKSAEIYQLAAGREYAPAQCNLGVMYEEGQGVPQDPIKAARFYTLSAEQGNVTAQFNLALMHHRGQGIPQDLMEAATRYKIAADAGDPQAQCNLGFLYEKGEGVPQDSVEAARLYRLSAEQGASFAQFNLNAMNEEAKTRTGLYSKPPFLDENKEYEDDSAHRVPSPRFNEQQVCDTETLYETARKYEEGDGVPKDEAKAAELYQLAAEQGDAWAQCNLGVMYVHGRGVPHDLIKAFALYTLSAEQGDVDAHFNLALMHHRGQGIPQNLTEAARHYKIAAEQGDSRAQFHLSAIRDAENNNSTNY